jgi:cell shape-determining protein MreC
MHATPQSGAGVRFLPATLVVLLVLALLPARWIGWVGLLGDFAELVVSPIANPLRTMAGWLRPARVAGTSAEIEQYREQIERLTAQVNRVEAENVRLRELIRMLQGGMAMATGAPTRDLAVSVISASSDLSSRLLRVRGGRRQGVEPGSVAVGAGLQLVGRVVEVEALTSLVRPITAKEAGPIQARVMLGETGPWLETTLRPEGDGTLRGPVEYRMQAQSPGRVLEASPGQVVRLDDPTWPEGAQMLLVGTVERVEPSPRMPGRQVVIVRPTLELHRVSEMILRVPVGEETPR